MFEGNTFFPVTGTPIRKMACMIRPLADAEPVPLAVAILNAKSLLRFIELTATSFQLPAASFQLPIREACQRQGNKSGKREAGGGKPTSSYRGDRNHFRRYIASIRNVQHELPHVPRVGRTPFGAEAAVQADVLVLQHHALGLLQ